MRNTSYRTPTDFWQNQYSIILKGQEYLPVTALDKRERDQNGPCMSRRELMTKVPAFWEVPSSVWRLEGELRSLGGGTVNGLPNKQRPAQPDRRLCGCPELPRLRYMSFEADRGWVLKTRRGLGLAAQRAFRGCSVV